MTDPGFVEKHIVGPVCKSYGYEKLPATPDDPSDPCLSWKKKVTAVATEKAEMQKDYESKIADIVIEKNHLQALLEKTVEMSDEEKYLRAKYPKVGVSYKCRPLPNFTESLAIDPRILITPDDYFIQQEIKKEGFEVDSKNHDELFVEIYKWGYKKKYQYAYDWNLYGPAFPELWEFPFEINARIEQNLKKGADCDGYTVLMKSYYNAAGLPDYKSRAVIGNCSLGGHATIEVLSDEDKAFHHLNSTYGSDFTKFGDLAGYPTRQDGIDGIDKLSVTGVWFSYDEMMTYSKFMTPQDEAAFHAFLGNKVKITPGA